MRPSLLFMRVLAFRRWLLPAIFCVLVSHAAAQTSSTDPKDTLSASVSTDHDPLVATAFDHFYNMDYDPAIAEFEKVLQRHPNDPAAVNHLLSTVLLRELYAMGAMNSGEYANDSFIGEAHRPAVDFTAPMGVPVVDATSPM